MVEEKFSFYDADDIEHALRSENAAHGFKSSNAAAMSGRPLMSDTTQFSIRADRTYSIDDFYRYEGAAFVTAAYLGLLERRPDPAGTKLYLSLLRHGTRKAMILSRIHYSGEGQQRKVHVRGLRLRYLFWRACEVPLIGYILESCALLISLPRMSASLRRLEYICNTHPLDEREP